MRAGEVVGNRFEILKRAGVGGMGVVYQAIDRSDGSTIALKMLHDYPEDESKSRFLREARLLYDLRHPVMVSYVAHGATPSGELFLAMEWLEGIDLLARIRSTGLTVSESVILGTRVSDALDFAHQRGIVHRDIKPKNLYLPGGEIENAKVLDFGIAHFSVGTQIAANTGLLGTPGYMAPEQATAEGVIDGRADIFSLGCVLFHCLTGRAPYGTGDMLSIAAKLLLEEPPRIELEASNLPRELTNLVQSMLSKDRDQRPKSAKFVADALRSLPKLSGHTTHPGVRSDDVPTIGHEEQRSVCVVVAVRQTDESGQATDDSVATVSLIAEKHGARVERLPQGGFVCVMSPSASSVDQAVAAVRCARMLRAAEPDLKCGVALGRGIVTGSLPVGGVIERASALIRSISDAVVALDESTAALILDQFEVEVTGEPSARVAIVRRERPTATLGRTLLGRKTPCVGRERELATLDATFRACVSDSAAQAILITGAPGIGKTRLLNEFLSSASREPDVSVWSARADAMSAGSPFGLLGQAIRRGLGVREAASDEEKRAVVTRRIGALMDAADSTRVAAFISELVGLPSEGGREIDPALKAARHNSVLMGDQMLRAVVDLFCATTREAPLIVVLEDLHWGDLPSVRFVDDALRTLSDRPLCVVGVARPEVSELFPSIWEGHPVTEIRLKGLSKKASERLVSEALGVETSPLRVSRIVERAEGNAFFLEELVRAVAAGRDSDTLPETVLATVEARLAELPGDARRVLRAASLFGQCFWSGGVLALLGPGGADARIGPWLKTLEERELISRRPTSRFANEVELAFRHALARDTAYAALTDEDKKLGHRLAAKWLESVGERDAVLLAEHLERGGESGRAVSFYRIGAEQALEGNDFEKVIDRSRRGVDAGAQGLDRAILLLLAAEARSWRGENAEAITLAERAIIDTRAAGGELHHRAILALSTLAGRLGQLPIVIELAHELMSQKPDPEAPERYFDAMASISNTLFYSGRSDLGDRTMQCIEEKLETIPPNVSVLAHVHRARSTQYTVRSNFEGALKQRIASARAFQEVGDFRQEITERVNVGNWQTELGALEEAEASLRTALEMAMRLRLKSPGANARSNLGRTLLWAGKLEEAAVLEERACAMFQAQGNLRLECASRAYLARIRLAQGDIEAADRETARALETSLTQPDHAYVFTLQACVALAGGLTAVAVERSTASIVLLDELGGIDEGEIFIRVTFAEALHAAKRLEEAKAALRFAYDRLTAQLALIESPAFKRSYVERIPENARTSLLAQDWLGLPDPL